MASSKTEELLTALVGQMESMSERLAAVESGPVVEAPSKPAPKRASRSKSAPKPNRFTPAAVERCEIPSEVGTRFTYLNSKGGSSDWEIVSLDDDGGVQARRI